MARSQPYTVACDGGLVKSANSIDLLRTPGVARELRNFEVSIEGGYRRINGFYKFGTTSATQPTGGTHTILGVMPYADGVVACANNAIYFSQDGITWMQINKLSAVGGDSYATFTAKAASVRTGQGQCTFAMFEAAGEDYGQIMIADNSTSNIFSFRMEGTGALNTRTFFTKEIQPNGANTPVKYITSHDHHLIAAGVDGEETTVYYSVHNDPDNFSGAGAGSITISDTIVGIKGFRADLIVFCENSIHKLINIDDSSTVAIVSIAESIGCLSGYSIQEIGGDLVFLAPDGIRTVAGTARIGDTELGTVSKAIQPLINDLARNVNSYTITSMVHRDKSQYRLFYTDTTLDVAQQRGIIGTLRPNGFQWSETRGIEVTAIGTNFNEVGIEEHFHGSTGGYVYVHDAGNSFDGANILARFGTPDYDYGDLGTLKTLHYLKVSASAEGVVNPDVQVRFDYGSTDTPQPTNLFDLGTIDPPSLFGEAIFGTNVFGGAENPLIRIPLQGSGYSNNFTIISDDVKAPYTINGFYIDFIPSGRR
jgi:hypothetical protein